MQRLLTIGSIILNLILLALLLTPSRTKLARARKHLPLPNSQPSLSPSPTPYSFLSPRLEIVNPNNVLINFTPLRSQLRERIARIPTPFSLFFEYLPSGVSIGINEQNTYALASLLKIPIVMETYRKFTTRELSPTQEITVTARDANSDFGDLYKRVGDKITIQEAITLTLTQSDNTAKNLLVRTLGSNSDYWDVFEYLDIPKDTPENTPVVNPKNYTSILKCLYLSCYLPKDHSQEILTLLTRSSFHDKLAAGVPPQIPVAHKIGVYGPNSSTKSVYTDCGIVFIPKRPYTLCLMSRSTESEARSYMSDLSRLVFKYVSTIETTSPLNP